MHLGPRALLAISLTAPGVLGALPGCTKLRTLGMAAVNDRVDIVADKTSYSASEAIQVTYTHPVPLDAGASSWWITL
jgi:hypothetical protein